MRAQLPFAIFALGLAASVPGQVVPTGFAVETIVSAGLDHPTDFCFVPDGRVLVASRSGQLAVHAGAATTAVPIGTLPWVTNPWNSPTGLPSLAADPAFATNGYVYVLHASALDTVLHLDRFTCTGALGNPTSTNLQLQLASRHVLLGSIPDLNFGSSFCGSVRFGPDGMLYVATDDDLSPCNAQLLLSGNGNLLRLDVSQRPPGGSLVAPPHGALDPGDNPFSANTDFSQLVVGIGLHAPSRLEIDFVTGNLYVGDVGTLLAQEVSEYVRPAAGVLPFVNFGWPWFEGAAPSGGCGGTAPAGLLPPIASMPVGGGWQRVVSGPRYRNQQGPHDFGPAYEGDLFVAERTTGEIRRFAWNGSWQLAAPAVGQPTATTWASGFQGVTSLRQGPDGALWILQQQVLQSGALRRVRAPGSTVVLVSGNGQRAPAGEAFPQPLVVRVFDPMANPMPGAAVDFTVLGGAALSAPNPVVADAQGFATVGVVSTFGGSVSVRASAPGSVPSQPFQLYGRRLSTSLAGNLFFVQIDNETDAVPAHVPYIVMLAWPGSPPLPTPIGPLCVDPTSALGVVIEDGVGAFGGISLSGSGALGMPGLYRQYTLPQGLFTGLQLRFQAVGVDPSTGWFRTNCTTRQF